MSSATVNVTVTGAAGQIVTEDQLVGAGRHNPPGGSDQPGDIARAVLYLSGDLGDYVTGQTLFVTGGSLMVP